jgi:hypothetical protein
MVLFLVALSPKFYAPEAFCLHNCIQSSIGYFLSIVSLNAEFIADCEDLIAGEGAACQNVKSPSNK